MSEFLSRANLTSTFFEHYRALAGLTKEQRTKVADFVAHCASEAPEEKDLQTLQKDLAAPAGQFANIAGIAVHLASQFKRVAQDIQTPEQLRAATEDVFEDENDRKILEELLEPSLKRAAEVELASRKYWALRTGNARIEGTYITCDLRPIFRKRPEDEESETVILDWMPVATLELISKLNEIEQNHLFLLDRAALLKLKARIERALREMQMLEEATESLPSRRKAANRERGGDVS